MQIFDAKLYIDRLIQHFEKYFKVTGKPLILEEGPKQKLHPSFFVLEFPPNEIHSMFSYCTVGMSVDRLDENLIELIVYAPKSDKFLLELMTVCASYHRNGGSLRQHTYTFWQPRASGDCS